MSGGTVSQTGAQKYNKNTDLKKGEHRMIFIHGKPVAYAKSDDESFKAEGDDVTTKMSGGTTEKMPGQKTWGYQIDALVSNTPGHLSYEALMSLSASGQAVSFEVAAVTVATDGKGDKTVTKGTVHRRGMVVISEVSKKSESGAYETFSVTLEGSGPLMDGAGNEVGSSQHLAAVGITLP